MTETNKTLVFVGAAVVLALLAILLSPSPPQPEEFSDQGEPFFPEFTDPNAARTLEVIEFDPETGATSAFKVTFENGRWVIPSHHNYPADAAEQLAQTAAGVIDIARDDFRSDNVADYETLGVVDPLTETAGLTGRGKRVTIKGSGGEVLADLIFGNEVENRPQFRYVRHPEEKRVYAANVEIDISTRFADWINQDLLEVAQSDISGIEINDYSINERTRSVNRRDRVVLELKSGTWTIPGLSSSQTVDSATVDSMLTTIDALHIVGVRPKPEGLSASLKAETETGQLSNADMHSLQSKGFYLSRDGALMSNEGELLVKTKDALEYTLRFGEVVYGSGLSATAGTDTTGTDRSGAQNQYLFVTVRFVPEAMPEPPRPADTSFVTKPDSLRTEAEKQAAEQLSIWKDWQRDVEQVQQKAQQLNDRFADWYYVIDHDSFRKLHKRRGELVVASS